MQRSDNPITYGPQNTDDARMHQHFLCIGAQKAGTTWLYRNLGQHPEVWLPPIKEIHFFNYSRYHPYPMEPAFYGCRWRRQFADRFWKQVRHPNLTDLKWDLRFFLGIRNRAWYRSIFKPGEGQVSGDITPAYSTLSETEVEYVKSLLPEAKVLFILRDPVERAWSLARMFAREGRISLEDEEQCLSLFETEAFRLRGNYLRTLENWQSQYPAAAILTVFFEEISEDPGRLFRRVCGFLGLDDSSQVVPATIRENLEKGQHTPIPSRIQGRLAEMYHPAIIKLHGRFGGYTTRWLETTERILDSR